MLTRRPVAESEAVLGRRTSVRRTITHTSRLVLGVAVGALAVFLAWPLQAPNAKSTSDYEVVRIYPHDFRAFTQGLAYEDGNFYESTGRLGKSSVRRVGVRTGVVLQKHNLGDEFFGEGLALVEDRLVQLTWTSGVGFVYDKHTVEQIGKFYYAGEGWGLAYDGTELAMSDGSAELRFLDPVSFEEIRRVTVRDANRPVRNLNELEYVEGELWANMWQSDTIARISPETGEVIDYVDLTGLLDHWAWNSLWPFQTDVLNGIAYDDETDRLFVTGKLWPVLFEISMRPAGAAAVQTLGPPASRRQMVGTVPGVTKLDRTASLAFCARS